MRHFSLLKLLTLTSFSTSTKCLSPSINNKTSGRAHRLKQSLMVPRKESVELFADSTDRRRTIQTLTQGIFGSLAFVSIGTKGADALDMDAFMNAQLESDTKNCDPSKDSKCIPKLSADEAMCKYGQSGEARGEACRRVKESGGALPNASAPVKSLGGAYAM